MKNSDKHKTLDWKPDQTSAFPNIINLVFQITENDYFNQKLETRVVCDASASRFLNSLEEKHSLTKLELLGVVWAIKHFKYYLYGEIFTFIADHQT